MTMDQLIVIVEETLSSTPSPQIITPPLSGIEPCRVSLLQSHTQRDVSHTLGGIEPCQVSFTHTLGGIEPCQVSHQGSICSLATVRKSPFIVTLIFCLCSE